MILQTNCSFTLNYLVYLQNLFLNAQRNPEETPITPLKFPFFDYSAWGMLTGRVNSTFGTKKTTRHLPVELFSSSIQ